MSAGPRRIAASAPIATPSRRGAHSALRLALLSGGGHAHTASGPVRWRQRSDTYASCALLVSSRSLCRCIDHQAFACLCMRGRCRKLVAIQTEAHACQEQSLAVCRAGSVSATPLAQPPKSECECSAAKRRWCRTFLAIVLASCSNMPRARSAAVSLGSGLPRVLL